MRTHLLIAGLVVSALGCGRGLAADRPRERVTLQLKWKHQFQFAGYYAAEAQGYYRAAGLEVALREAEPGRVADERGRKANPHDQTFAIQIPFLHLIVAPAAREKFRHVFDVGGNVIRMGDILGRFLQ